MNSIFGRLVFSAFLACMAVVATGSAADRSLLGGFVSPPISARPTLLSGESIPHLNWIPVATVDGPWNVSFQEDRGAPPNVKLERLESLSHDSNPGIKYFSGVATYRARFRAPRTWLAGKPLMLDLGQIGDVAEVSLNGRPAGAEWAAPYRLDIAAQVRSGVNELEIRVANLWVNRLIGDAQRNAKKITWTAKPVYRADAPLRPAGLIGPVRLLVGKQ